MIQGMRGFAKMTPEQRSAIASKGGKAAHAKGTAHEFTREEAIAAGKKGARVLHGKGKTDEHEKQPDEPVV